MLIHCDVTRARTEACYDLPARTSVRMKAVMNYNLSGQLDYELMRFRGAKGAFNREK